MIATATVTVVTATVNTAVTTPSPPAPPSPPHHPPSQSHYKQAQALSGCGRHLASAAAYRRVLALNPGVGEAALRRRVAGELQQAQVECEECVSSQAAVVASGRLRGRVVCSGTDESGLYEHTITQPRTYTAA